MSKESDYIKSIDGAERRYFTSEVRTEKRDDGTDLGIVEGYAAMFNSPTTIGSWFREEILPGFFDDVLLDDVRALFNHDPNFILARCVNGKGSLEIWVDDKGLKYRYKTPDRQYAKDLQNAIEVGDVSQSSFSFRPKETIWRETEGELDLRQLVKCETLYDVSPVTYPAYPDTEVAKRSHQSHIDAKKQKDADQRSDNNKVLSRNAAQLIINENL